MIDLPGDRPLPHRWLDRQQPLTFTLKKGDLLYRAGYNGMPPPSAVKCRHW
jgi:hypothetical protein